MSSRLARGACPVGCAMCLLCIVLPSLILSCGLRLLPTHRSAGFHFSPTAELPRFPTNEMLLPGVWHSCVVPVVRAIISSPPQWKHAIRCAHVWVCERRLASVAARMGSGATFLAPLGMPVHPLSEAMGRRFNISVCSLLFSACRPTENLV